MMQRIDAHIARYVLCEKPCLRSYLEEALERAKSLVSARVMEVQRFAEAASKPCLERLNSLVERNNAGPLEIKLKNINRTSMKINEHDGKSMKREGK